MLEDVDQACTMISNECNANASVIWGVNFDETLDDEMQITLIAAGFDKEPAEAPAAEEEEKETEQIDALDALLGNM